MEHAADERAVATAKDERRRYGRVLLDLVADAPARPTPVGLGAYRDLRSRIAAIVRPATTPLALQLGIAGAVAGVVVACAAVPIDEELESTERSADCDTLRQIATTAHDRSERERDVRQHELAIATYDEYIDVCAHDAEHYETMLYYAAEAHWAAAVRSWNAGDTDAAEQSWKRARALFDRVIDEGAGKFTNDAAYGQFMSVRNAVRWDPRAEDAPCEGCEPLAFVPYDATEREVLAAWDRLVEVTGRPTNASATELLEMARLRMQHNDFAAARPDLEELVVAHPGTEAGLRAAEMLVDVLTIAWTRAEPDQQAATGAELAHWVFRIQESSTYAMDEAERLRQAAPTLLAGVEWKEALVQLTLAEATDDPEAYRECAERFTALAAAYPDHPKIDVLRRNAETCAAAGH